MSVTKIPTDIVISDMERQCMISCDERQRRQFLTCKACTLGYHGVSLVAQAAGVCIDTIYSGIRELKSMSNESFPKNRVRKVGEGRKPVLEKHSEYLSVFDEIAEAHTAGLPQDPDVVWLTVSTLQMVTLFRKHGINVSPYTVRQMKTVRGFRDRSFAKSLTLKDVKDRNAQFEKIKSVLSECESAGIPVYSIDTKKKKKEMIGNFKRPGKVSAKGGTPKSNDHDFKTFSKGTIVPHGIFDVNANKAYITLGTSHDTSDFVCDNIERGWTEHLQWQYPDTDTICILCDGGGSNACSHHVVKQSFMRLSSKLGINIIMLHYPRKCPKFVALNNRYLIYRQFAWCL